MLRCQEEKNQKVKVHWPKPSGSERKNINEFLLLSKIVTLHWNHLENQFTEQYWLHVDQSDHMDDFDDSLSLDAATCAPSIRLEGTARSNVCACSKPGAVCETKLSNAPAFSIWFGATKKQNVKLCNCCGHLNHGVKSSFVLSLWRSLTSDNKRWRGQTVKIRKSIAGACGLCSSDAVFSLEICHWTLDTFARLALFFSSLWGFSSSFCAERIRRLVRCKMQTLTY